MSPEEARAFLRSLVNARDDGDEETLQRLRDLHGAEMVDRFVRSFRPETAPGHPDRLKAEALARL